MGEIIEKFDELGMKINQARQNNNPYMASLSLIDTYNYAKKVSNKDNKDEIHELIVGNECAMPIGYILNVNSKYNYDEMYIDENVVNIDSFSSKDHLLNYIVFMIRYYVVSRFKPGFIYENGAIDKVDMLNLCYWVSKKVKKFCDKLNIKCELVRIDPAFNKEYDLLKGYGHHYFNIITIEGEKYIIDCSYKQFFDIMGNFLEKLGIYGTIGPYCGIYMLQNEDRLKTATKLLEDGWIELDENNMKNYFDGFALSYRNALYYENMGCIDFSTNYTAKDYENFVFGDDDQGKRENIDYLGKQKIIIKKPKLIFKTDENILERLKK